MNQNPPTDDFRRIDGQGGLSNNLFPIYFSKTQNQYGMRVDQNHINTLGIMHGGVTACFCDIVLGNTSKLNTDKATVTLNLAIDYLNAAKLGDWIIADVRLSKKSTRILFCDLIISSNEGY